MVLLQNRCRRRKINKKLMNTLDKKYGEEETKKPTPKCLICKIDMETIKLNQPFCGECLSVLTELVKNKKDE